VALIIVATYGGSRLVSAQTEPPEVEMPSWTVQEIPQQLGNWRGEEARLDPEIAVATGAEIIANRNYRDPRGHAVVLHTAMFKNPAAGIAHTPSICYRTSGWKLLNQSFENIQVSNDLAIPVKLMLWEREGESILVVCWYQLGSLVLYERLDMAEVRWQLRGQRKWPMLTKVMLQIPAADLDDARTTLMGFTEQVVKWLNQPEHRKYLDRWPGA
jgi:EpsI family protein